MAQREIDNIRHYISGEAEIMNIDEGNLFKIKNAQYFQGELWNTAMLASAKDVEINVDFFSKTNTKVGSQTLTIYEYIRPGKSVKFKERIDIPDKVSYCKYQIIGVKGE